MAKYSFLIICLLQCSCVYHSLTKEEPVDPYVCEPTISWQNDILPIMTTSCALVTCHDGKTRRDWTDYNQVKLHAASIRKKTLDRSMPFDEPLPQHQIDMIACWVDNGALNN